MSSFGTCDYPGCTRDSTELNLNTAIETCVAHRDYGDRRGDPLAHTRPSLHPSLRPVAPRTPRLRGSVPPAPASPYPPGEATVAIGVDWSCTPSKSTVVVCEVQPDGSIHVISMSDMECGNETTGGQDF